MKVALRIYAAIFTPLIIQAVLANECFLNSTPTSSLNNSILIQSQSDADSQLQGCTTVLGSIEIAQNYTGALSLPSVANITGKILQENGSNTPYITSIQLENLIYIDSVRIDSAAALESISFPELSSATTLSFNGNSGPKIDCPSLVTASHINIIGLGFEINFPVLANVAKSLFLVLDVFDPDQFLSGEDVSSDTVSEAPPLNISLPSLQKASSIVLAGNITNLSLPVLDTALLESTVSANYSNTFGLSIYLFGAPLDVNLPELRDSDGVLISGNIHSISIPSLLTLSGDLDILSYQPLALNMPNLTDASSIYLEGNISSASFPSLQTLESTLSINAPLSSFDCNSAYMLYQRTTDPSSQSSFICVSHNHRHLSAGAIIGIVVGAVVLVAVLFFGWRKLRIVPTKKAYSSRRGMRNLHVGEHSADGLELGVAMESHAIEEGRRTYSGEALKQESESAVKVVEESERERDKGTQG